MKNLQVQERNCASGNALGNDSKRRPDSCWSWLVCVASAISILIVSGIGYSFGLLLPPLMENFEASRQATGNKTIYLRTLKYSLKTFLHFIYSGKLKKNTGLRVNMLSRL